MIHYRFPLLISITFCCLGWSANSNAQFKPFEPGESNRKVEIVAQETVTESSPSLSADSNTYDQYMQEGYQATKEQNYQTAKEKFSQALEVRPNDIYAEQALQNVDVYLRQQENPFSNFPINQLWLLLGILAILFGLGTAFWLFFRRLSAYRQAQFEEGLLMSQDEEEYRSPKSFGQPINKTGTDDSSHSSVKESALSVQPTTRLPNQDQVETLMNELQETDPKKRRQAIWELAQKADSRAMQSLVDLMIDTDSQERSLILEALSQISSRTLKPMNQALAISLQDKNPQVRKNAIRDLTRIYELMSQISQMLYHAIDDTDQEVQETAKWAINQLNTQMPPPLEMLNHDANSEITVEKSYSDPMEEL